MRRQQCKVRALFCDLAGAVQLPHPFGPRPTWEAPASHLNATETGVEALLFGLLQQWAVFRGLSEVGRVRVGLERDSEFYELDLVIFMQHDNVRPPGGVAVEWQGVK